MVQYARLHVGPPEMWIVSVYSLSRHHLDSIITIPLPVLASLTWWRDPGSIPFAVPHVSVT